MVYILWSHQDNRGQTDCPFLTGQISITFLPLSSTVYRCVPKSRDLRLIPPAVFEVKAHSISDKCILYRNHDRPQIFGLFLKEEKEKEKSGYDTLCVSLLSNKSW